MNQGNQPIKIGILNHITIHKPLSHMHLVELPLLHMKN